MSPKSHINNAIYNDSDIIDEEFHNNLIDQEWSHESDEEIVKNGMKGKNWAFTVKGRR